MTNEGGVDPFPTLERLITIAGLQNDPPPLVPAAGRFTGQVAVVAHTRIDGEVAGSLKGPGRLRVCAHARVEGVIECARVEIQGRVTGSIQAGESVLLGPGGQLDGDVDAPTLEVSEEARWTGRARVGR